MEAVAVVSALGALIAAAGGYLMWRDRRRGVSADDPAIAPPPGATDPHGVAGSRPQQESGTS